MNETTIKRLNAINREFYRITAKDFDETRATGWDGWEQLLPYIAKHGHSNALKLSVLDVGCGNGRFGDFLAHRLTDKPDTVIHYHGVDNSPSLLEIARTRLSNHLKFTFTLEERDIVENPPDSSEYDLVVAFGVLHHIPGYVQRQAFVRALADRVEANGLLVFTCWRFYEYERYRKRIVEWPEDLRGQVERHDYLLDWRRGENALRYCHYVDDVEHAALVSASGLSEIASYRADGIGDANRYSVLRKL